jgi:hypothetical protein
MLTVTIDILPRGDDHGRKALRSTTIVGAVHDLAVNAVTAAEAATPARATPG